MKVLFAVSNERDAEAITKVYQKEYKEIISSKIVYYYNAIIKELQKDKTYDRIVISEDIEMSVNDNYQAVDKMLFDKMDAISDEATGADGEDIPIILLSNDRRTKNDPLLSKLFGLGLYNVLIGQDRSIQKVCQLMYRPRTKKEAKSYYHVESDNVNYSANEKDDGVSDSEIQNILNHYKKIGNNISKVCQSFDSIVSQYSKEQVKMIVDVLPIDTKVILEENSDEYRRIMGITGKKAKNKSELRKEKYVEKQVDSRVKLNKPVIIPAVAKTSKVVKVPNKAELELEKKRAEKEILAKKKAEMERIENEKIAKRKEKERLLKEKAEKEKIAREKAKAEAERKEREELERQKAGLKAEKERLAREKAKAEADRKEKERIAREKAEAEAKKKEEERIAREKAEAERKEREELARQKAELEAERAKLAEEKAKIEAEKQEKIAREKAKAEAEKKEQERLARKKEMEELARQKAELEAEKAKLAEEKAKAKEEAEKKSKKSANNNTVKAKKEETTETVKRGRGRPRKEPIIIEEKEEVTQKRGRGRPRKEVKPEVDEVEEDIDLIDINTHQEDEKISSFEYDTTDNKTKNNKNDIEEEDDDLDLISLDDEDDDDIDLSDLDNDEDDDIDLSDLDEDDDDIDLSDLDDDEDDDIDLSDLDENEDDDIDLSDLDNDADDDIGLSDLDEEDDDIDLSDLDEEDDDIDLSDLDEEDDDIDLSDLDDEDDDIDLSDLDEEDDDIDLSDLDEEDDDIDLSDLDDEDDDIDLSDLDEEDDDIDLSDLDEEDDDIDLSDLDEEDDDIDLSDLDDEDDDLDIDDINEDDLDLDDLDDEDNLDIDDDEIDLTGLDEDDDLDINDIEEDDVDLSDLDEEDDLDIDDIDDDGLDLGDLDVEDDLLDNTEEDADLTDLEDDDLNITDLEDDDNFDIPEFDEEEENEEVMDIEDKENQNGINLEDDEDLSEFDDDILNFDDDILDDNEDKKGFVGISNRNYKHDNNLAQSIKNIDEEEDLSDFNIDTDSLINANQKMVAFVGTSKNGTSFIVNNLAETYSNKGIKTAILDLTKNKNSYYIYTNDDDNLRKKSFECFDKLRNGMADGVNVNNYLDVYTSLPGEDEGLQDVKNIITTLLENYTIVLLDCDFLTDARYFKVAQEIYLVQTYDILTIQPLTSFLRDLKVKGILDPNKLRIVINKNIKVNGINERNIIGGMSVYKDPGMTYMTDLFNKDTIRFTTVPFEEQIYAKYLEGIANCKISHKGYSKNFVVSINKLSDMVYSKVDTKKSKKNYNDYMSNSQKGEKFSKDTKTILNKMKKNY